MHTRLCLLLLAALPSFFSTNARAELPPRYDFTFIPELLFPYEQWGVGQLLNNQGQIVASGSLWQNGSITLLGGATSGINNSGQVGGSLDGHAVIWSGLIPTPLQSLSTDGHGHVFALNDSGQATGLTDSPSSSERVPVIWNGTVPTPLYPASGDIFSINNQGQIVGRANLGTENAPVSHAVLWEGSTYTDLGTLGEERIFSVAQSINDAGQVVGFAYRPDFGDRAAFLWQDGVMSQLPGVSEEVEAWDINNWGQIVGQDGSPEIGNGDGAVIWDGGNQYDLNDYLSPQAAEDGWVLIRASSINDNGQIVGIADNYAKGVFGTFLLTPVPEPETYAMLMVGLSLIGLAARKRKFLPSPVNLPVNPC